MRTRSSFPALSRSHNTARATRHVARGQERCAGLSASTANHDLNSARAHHTGTTACMRNCKFLHEHTGARGSRGRNGAQRAPEVGTGGPTTMAGPRSGPLSSSGACAARSSDKSRRVSRLAPGCCCGGGFYRCCWWWAEHTARLRANIHSVSALLPGACVPSCCT